jgi:hypothetical protein
MVKFGRVAANDANERKYFSSSFAFICVHSLTPPIARSIDHGEQMNPENGRQTTGLKYTRASAFTFSMSKFYRKTAGFEEKIHREEDRYALNKRE